MKTDKLLESDFLQVSATVTMLARRKIETTNARGAEEISKIIYDVHREIRNIVIECFGKTPEDILKEGDFTKEEIKLIFGGTNNSNENIAETNQQESIEEKSGIKIEACYPGILPGTFEIH